MQLETPSPVEPASSLNATPLFQAAWQFALGIATTHWIYVRPSIVLVALAPVAILCALAAWRAQRIAWLPLATLWVLLGTWCAQMEPAPAPSSQLVAMSDGLLRTIEGTVTSVGPVRGELEQNLSDEFQADKSAVEPSQRIDVSVDDIEKVDDREDVQVPASGAVRLTVRWPEGDAALPFQCGERVHAVVRLAQPETYHDPGVWSRKEYLVDQGITATAGVQSDRIEQTGRQEAAWRCRIAVLQHATTARLLALPRAMQGLPAPLRMSEEDAVMIAAMVAGDRTYLTHTLRVGFERTGSFHMLVVSGFHLALVAGFIFWLARRLRLPRVPATLLTIAASFAYALFTGFATPVQRSLWMVTIYLLGRLFYRQRSPMNVIGSAALCLLVASPRSLFDSSLQMTLLAVVAVAGVAALLLAGTIHPYLTATRDLRLIEIDGKLAPKIAQFRVLLRMAASLLSSAGHRWIAWRILPWTIRAALRAVELLVVSCIVELAMTWPMAVYFHRITLFALPVNMLILPLLGVLMPAALITLVALVAWPGVAAIPAAVVAAVLHIGVGMVRLFGSLNYGDFRIATPLLWQSAAFVALLGAAIALAHSSVAGGRRRQRWLAWAAMVLAAAAAVAPRAIEHPRNALLFEAIDVGQGDSLLLITPDGKTLLVDGGGFGGGPRQVAQDYDIGEEVVSQALWARGIRHLDAVALSHAHSDHMGGLPAVVRNFHPEELWVGNNPHVAAYDALLDEARELHTRVRAFRAGDAFSFGDAQINVLAPFRSYTPEDEPTNNDSMVLHVAYGSTSVLLEGDAEAPIEHAMTAEADLASTVLKVGHHGSRTSTTPEFLARVQPQWAVISCGLHNRYGHPRQEVLEELQAAHVRTYRTDDGGLTCFALDGKTVAAGCGSMAER